MEDAVSEGVEYVKSYVDMWRSCSGTTPYRHALQDPRRIKQFMASIATFYANSYGIDMETLVPDSRECFQIRQDAGRGDFVVRRAVFIVEEAARSRIHRLKNIERPRD